MEAKRSSSDRISTFPENVIEIILCLVPLKDAVRTSILARDWRYNWTKIPKLVFKERGFEASNRKSQLSTVARTYKLPYPASAVLKRCDFFLAVHQVLLLRQGPIHEFTLDMMHANTTCHEIDQIILYLSRNHTLKKFSLTCNSYKLPSSIFSLHQLTDLYLAQCIFDPEPTFIGFGSLKNLYLSPEQISTKTLFRLLSNCPLLKTLTLMFSSDDIVDHDNSFYTIIQLFECLPVLEHLTMRETVVKCFDHDYLVHQVLPSSLINLKYFCLEETNPMGYYALPFLALLIRSSPNLEKLKLQIDMDSDDDNVKIEDYSDIWLNNLNEFEIEYFSNTEIELEVVKLILAKSPALKILRLIISGYISKDEELVMLKILLRSPRVSLAVNIFVERG